MKESGVTRLVNSPLLLTLMLCSLYAVSMPLYRMINASFIPDLPGYSLSRQKEAVVICYRPGCGCEAHTVTWTAQALARNKVTVVISNQYQPDIAFIKRNYGSRGAVVLMNVAAPIIERFSPSGATTVVLVQDGRIVKRATGNGALDEILARSTGGR